MTAETVTLQLEGKEKAELIEKFSHFDKDTLKNTFEAISMMVRAFEGKAVEPDDVITRLINVKNILERSRFPTMPIIQEQVYCRLLAKYHPELEPFLDYAESKAQALISYKGENWDYYTEMVKAQSGQIAEPTTFNFGSPTQQLGQGQPQKKYGRIFNRKPKEAAPELEQ